MKFNKAIVTCSSLFITICITFKKLYFSYKDPKIDNMKTFLSADTLTLILTLTSLIFTILIHFSYFRRKYVWIKYKLGWLNINYVFKATVDIESIEKLKERLNTTFNQTRNFKEMGREILNDIPHEYLANYSSLASLMKIKYSSQNDEESEEERKYEIVLKGNLPIKKLDVNFKFLQAFFDDIVVKKISLTILESNSELKFIDKEKESLYAIEDIRKIEKRLNISLSNEVEVNINTSTKKAYLSSTTKNSFFSCYDDFKYILTK